MSDGQVEACAGGILLRTEAVYYALQKNTKHINRSIQALLGALQQVREGGELGQSLVSAGRGGGAQEGGKSICAAATAARNVLHLLAVSSSQT